MPSGNLWRTPFALVRLVLIGGFLAASFGFAGRAHAADSLTYTPKVAGIGTVITITGRVADATPYIGDKPLPYHGAISAYLERSQGSAYVSLFPTGTMTISADRQLTVRLSIPATERFYLHFQQAPPISKPTSPGLYHLSFPCHGCPLGTVTIRSSSLPFTGARTGSLALLGLGLVATGTTALIVGRSRNIS
jgi:hypothetical protein